MQTCWQRGLTRLEENPALCTIRPQIEQLRLSAHDDPGVDILSPLGTLLVGSDGKGDDDEDDDDDDDIDDITACHSRAHVADRMEGVGSMVEIEDAVAEEDVPEAEVRKFLPYVKLPDGKKMNKGKLLAMLLKHRKVVASSDRLKRYKDVSCFDATAIISTMQARHFEMKDGELTLIIGDVIVSLLQCENRPFLCLGEVLRIQVDSELVE